MWVTMVGSVCRVGSVNVLRLAMCSILVGLVISNDTPASYFVLFLL